MLIALDYDETYTRDPVLWDGFVASAAGRGHRVVCVTMRHPEEAVGMPCDVIYTGRKAKRAFVEALMIHIDIWIDDAPHFILMDSAEVQPGADGADLLPSIAGATVSPDAMSPSGIAAGQGKPTWLRRMLEKVLASGR